MSILRAVAERIQQAWHELPTYFQQDVVMIAVLGGICLLLGWAFNSGYKRTERGPTVRTMLFMFAALVALVMRHVHVDGWRYGILAAVLLIGGFAGRSIHPRGLWMVHIAIAALLGAGWALTAMVLAAAVFILLYLSPTERR